MFVLSVAVLISKYLAKISVDDSLQHVAKFSHPVSARSSAILSFPGKLETDDSIPFCFNKRISDFGMTWDFVATFQGSAILGWLDFDLSPATPIASDMMVLCEKK